MWSGPFLRPRQPPSPLEAVQIRFLPPIGPQNRCKELCHNFSISCLEFPSRIFSLVWDLGDQEGFIGGFCQTYMMAMLRFNPPLSWEPSPTLSPNHRTPHPHRFPKDSGIFKVAVTGKRGGGGLVEVATPGSSDQQCFWPPPLSR